MTLSHNERGSTINMVLILFIYIIKGDTFICLFVCLFVADGQPNGWADQDQT